MPEVQFTAPSFSDSRVFLVHGNDERCEAYFDESAAVAMQEWDGPTFLVIGRDAPDEKLPKLAQRYGFTVESLRAFRDGTASRVVEVSHV